MTTDFNMASEERTVAEENVNISVSAEEISSEATAVSQNAAKEQSSQDATTASVNDNGETPDRSSFDYTNRKVIVRNVMKNMRRKEVDQAIQSWLQALGDRVVVVKNKKAPNQPWLSLTLQHEDMVEPFIKHMNASKFTNKRGALLTAARATDKEDRKRKGDHRDDGSNQGDSKRQKQSPKTDDEVRDVITPLWRKSYPEQLVAKHRDMIRKCSAKIVGEVKKRFRNLEQEAKRNANRDAVPVYDWVKSKRPIEIEQILPSPKQTQYRNKCEMNFGYSYETANGASGDDSTDEPTMKKTPAVGFMASGWSGGVSRPHILANIPSEACAIVDVVNEFLKTSPTRPYDSKTHRGLWRVLTIRISRRTKECMVVVMHAPPSGGIGAVDESDDTTHVWEAEKARLVSMLTNRDITVPERDCKVVALEEETDKNETGELQEAAPGNEDDAPATVRVTTLFFQEYGGASNPPPEHPVQHVFGKRSIQERLGNCTFQISPGAFFQVNTEGAETLYNLVVEKVREVSPNPQETLLLDVCCGTGTIGQYCMKEGAVGRVLGVDISEPAIEDAKINAELNGFGTISGEESEQTRFVAAKAEDVLGHELNKDRSSSCPVVAVVDPARDGLHSIVLRILRNTGRIQRIVYVSCNPTGSLVQNAGVLCSPSTKKLSGRPFYPSSARPVDMFPSTPHCEMVMTFDRLPNQS